MLRTSRTRSASRSIRSPILKRPGAALMVTLGLRIGTWLKLGHPVIPEIPRWPDDRGDAWLPCITPEALKAWVTAPG